MGLILDKSRNKLTDQNRDLLTHIHVHSRGATLDDFSGHFFFFFFFFFFRFFCFVVVIRDLVHYVEAM